MTHLKSLQALTVEKLLLDTSGPAFAKGVAFMFSAGLSPDRVTVMQTRANKFLLQFHLSCDVRPFTATYLDFNRLLRGLVHLHAWRLKSLDFLNVAFQINYVPLIERTVERLGVKLVQLNNCSYPGIERGDQALRLFAAFNRENATVVCEYGDVRLRTLIDGYRNRPLRRAAAVAINNPIVAPVAPAPEEDPAQHPAQHRRDLRPRPRPNRPRPY